MLIVQSTVDSKPKPQIGKFLSLGNIQSAVVKEGDRNPDGNMHTLCDVLI